MYFTNKIEDSNINIGHQQIEHLDLLFHIIKNKNRDDKMETLKKNNILNEYFDNNNFTQDLKLKQYQIDKIYFVDRIGFEPIHVTFLVLPQWHAIHSLF